MTAPSPEERAPDKKNWTELIDDICAGEWVHPRSGNSYPPAPYEMIVIEESLDGAEADLVRSLGMGGAIAVVADTNTWDAMGARVAGRLGALGTVDTIILDRPHADVKEATDLAGRLGHADAVVAVGSGTVNDLCKYITARDGRKYCVFGTAPSMNGYTSTTASMSLESGLKVSLPAHATAGFFVDLSVSADAPKHLVAAGFGDCLCRSVAQIDWWMSHRVLGSVYYEEPYLIEMPDEVELNKRAHLLPGGDIEAVGYLYRVLTLCGLGISFTGISNHGSMGEHQISHYIDCFAGDRHPGALHGQQVGVASLTMARIQHRFLSSETPPVVGPTRIDAEDMARRMGAEIASQCHAEYQKKAFDGKAADAFNEKIAQLWPALRRECLDMMLPVEEMQRLLSAAGGATTAQELGLPVDFYREAVRHAHEMRDRFSFADIACDSGVLDDLVAAET